MIPLDNLSGDPEQQYFADGMTDALITDLAKMGSLRITSRTSVMRYKQTKRTIKDIGRELDVDAVVEGTVTRAGSRVRITAQLIQVSTDMHLWAETYERDVSEVLELQREVATDIARRIDVVVRPLDRPRVVQPEAYGLYLKGRYAFYQYTSQGRQRAIEHFTRAIERDPAFASAYSGLADTYVVAGAYDAIPADEALTRGKAAAAKALELDERLAGAHYALATAHTWDDWDWPSAEREFRRAVELDPNHALGRNWHGGYLSLRRRHQEAIAEHERARDLDPRSLIVNANLGRALYWARRYDEAITQARRTLELDPRFGIALFWLEGSLRHQGLLKEAVALRQQVATPERAQMIARTFERDGFPALLRECGSGLSGQRIARDRRPVLRPERRHRAGARAARGLFPPALLRAGQYDGGAGLRRAAGRSPADRLRLGLVAAPVYLLQSCSPMMHPPAGQDIHRFIFETSSKLRNAGDPEKVLRHYLRAAVDFMQADRGYVARSTLATRRPAASSRSRRMRLPISRWSRTFFRAGSAGFPQARSARASTVGAARGR